MNGPEHYREAERLANLLDDAMDSVDEAEKLGDRTDAEMILRIAEAGFAAAQVHATLALAAATLQAGSLRNFENTVDAWAPLVAARRPVNRPGPRP